MIQQNRQRGAASMVRVVFMLIFYPLFFGLAGLIGIGFLPLFNRGLAPFATWQTGLATGIVVGLVLAVVILARRPGRRREAHDN